MTLQGRKCTTLEERPTDSDIEGYPEKTIDLGDNHYLGAHDQLFKIKFSI